MPKIGLILTESRMVDWRKREEEKIEKGDILFVFRPDKTAFEMEAPESGF